MGVSASACFRPLRAALFAGFPLIALVTIAAAEPLSDGVNAYARKEYATAKRILRPLAERVPQSLNSTLGSPTNAERAFRKVKLRQ